jgi:hypothetical protein
MKKILFLCILINTLSFAQDTNVKNNSKKGSFYAYWGWNRSVYSTSDISFKGVNYDFTLYDVAAKDRQSPFAFDTYFLSVTIPQYNLRLAYYLNDKYHITLGVDHMKYVMRAYQNATISGTITNSGTIYDGTYNNTPLEIKPDLLQFEHTDGLNYINTEIRRNDVLLNKGILEISAIEGVGGGILLPRTNTSLLNNPRYDQFHLAGFGVGAMLGLNIEFKKHFFILSEIKAGYINMPSIRTTMFDTDIAKQHFTFVQGNIVFGYRFFIGNKKQ